MIQNIGISSSESISASNDQQSLRDNSLDLQIKNVLFDLPQDVPDEQARILMVDDQIFNLIAQKSVIESMFGIGHLVDSANNGLEAVKIIKDDFDKNKFYSSYKLILMDC